MELNWILKNIIESIVNFMDSIFEAVSWAINDLFMLGAQYAIDSQNSPIPAICIVTGVVAFSLIVLFVMKQIFSTYIMETDGDPDSDPLDLVMKASIAIALISCNTEIYTIILTMAETFGRELFGSLNDIEIKNAIEAGIDAARNVSTTGAIMTCLYTLVFIIGTIVLCIKAGIRGAELCLMKILFPFFACDIITTRRERWNAFFTAYLVTMFGYTFQILCFRISGNGFSSFIGNGINIKDVVPAFAFLYLAIKTPKWLEKFVYTSGIGQTVGGGARTGAYMLPSLLRMAK